MANNFDQLTRSVVLGDDASPVRQRFLDEYSAEVSAFVTEMATAFDTWDRLSSKIGYEFDAAHLSALVYSALHNHVLSMKLLLEGLMVAAGNAQRFTLESIAMALLASNRSLDFLQRYSAGKYSTSKAIRDLRRNAAILGLDKIAIVQLEEQSKFYDQYSHPTLLTVASLITLGGPDSETVFGSVFDDGKRNAYGKEINSRIGLASVLPNFMQGVEENFLRGVRRQR